MSIPEGLVRIPQEDIDRGDAVIGALVERDAQASTVLAKVLGQSAVWEKWSGTFDVPEGGPLRVAFVPGSKVQRRRRMWASGMWLDDTMSDTIVEVAKLTPDIDDQGRPTLRVRSPIGSNPSYVYQELEINLADVKRDQHYLAVSEIGD